MIHKPGKVFHYDGCNTVLLGYIFYKLTNITIDKYAVHCCNDQRLYHTAHQYRW